VRSSPCVCDFGHQRATFISPLSGSAAGVACRCRLEYNRAAVEGSRLDPARQQQAKGLARAGYLIALVQLLLSVAFWTVFLFTDLSSDVRDFCGGGGLQAAALYIFVVLVWFGALVAPLAFYRGFVLSRRYGLSHQTLGSWLADFAKSGALGLVLVVGLMVVIYWLLEAYPSTWWVIASALAVSVMMLLTTLVPVIIIPLFFKLTPLDDEAIQQRLAALAGKAGVKVRGVYVMGLSAKTSAGNAMLAGLGRTRRVVLGDTVLDRYSVEEVEAAVAHELGHHVHRDIPRMFVLQALFLVVGFYFVNLALGRVGSWPDFNGVADVAALPVFALVLEGLSLVLSPALNAYSRHLEAAADRYALSLTGDRKAFTGLMTKLTDQNLSDARPSRWAEVLFYDHPPYWKRVRVE